MAMIFDTRNAVRRLLQGELSEPQADAVVDVMGDAASTLTTKDDLRAAIQEMRTEFYRALAVQTLIFAGIVAALTKL